jgi:hypothetical protein
MVNKFTPPAATHYGHLRQHRQGLNSTQSPLPTSQPTDSTSSSPDESSDYLFTSTQSSLHNDLTGAFKPTSRSGHNFMLIMFSPTHNYIHVEPQKSRSTTDFITAYSAGLKFWATRGVTPTSLRVDNELPAALRTFITNRIPNLLVEFCPPNSHRANKAERAIQTFKDHFISTMATVDPSFPTYLWDALLPQAELTLNLMRCSTVSPSISIGLC